MAQANQAHAAILEQKDIVGLDVAMDDLAPMQMRDALGKPGRDAHPLRQCNSRPSF